MTLEEGLYDYLPAQGSFSAVAGSRIYPDKAPQDVTEPYVVYTRISTDADRALSGPTGLESARIMFELYGTKAQVISLRGVIKTLLDGFSGTMGTVSVDNCYQVDDSGTWEDGVKHYRSSLDFLITHRET